MWIATSILAFMMLYLTERKSSKGFALDEAFIGMMLCAIPFIFFLVFSAGLIVYLKDRKKQPTKVYPTITEKDIKQYRKLKKINP